MRWFRWFPYDKKEKKRETTDTLVGRLVMLMERGMVEAAAGEKACGKQQQRGRREEDGRRRRRERGTRVRGLVDGSLLLCTTSKT